MLEADEVDIDLFTPVASTSLAKLFNNDKNLEDNTSLKYVPQPVQNAAPQKHEESKATDIICASAFYGYEWSDNAYVSKGKLGAAILKNKKTEQYNIILYDSNKVTLSCANISSQLEVVIKENTNLSFYDNQRKYWSIYGTEVEISKYVGTLKSLGVNIKTSNDDDSKSQPEIKEYEANQILSQNPTDDKESDTDSSINRRTKDSILKRMATMGHSVLPMQSTNYYKSNSSDSDQSTEEVVRHKPQRSIIKNKITKKMDCTDSCSDINWKSANPIIKSSDNIPVTSYDHQLVPIASSNIITNPVLNNSSELNLFMSEQRISNSELRINMNRVTDKIDKILDTLQGVGDQASNNVNVGYQNSIVQKLLNEYENKIKLYEDFIMSKGLDCSILKSSQELEKNDINIHKSKIKDLQNSIEKKERENSRLSHELKSLEEKYNTLCKEKEEDCNNKSKEITTLKDKLTITNKDLKSLTAKLESNSLRNEDDIKNKLKSIMNRTFHTLSANFDSNESYTGTAVKSLLASVIKKETVEALNEV